jgi:N-acetylmuramoyl-L-alanine amidase
MIHVVAQGDHLSSIAARYGFGDPRTIWNRPENADLRQRRPDPNVLFPGDQVFVPEPQVKTFTRTANARYRFVVNLTPLKVRAKLLNPFGKPIANGTGTLVIDGAEEPATSDGDGVVDCSVPRTARSAEVHMNGAIFRLAVGHLDPADTSSGAAARLGNLGYRYTTPTSVAAEREQLEFAARLFVDENQIDLTSEAPESFVDRLRKAHGS